jgi:hypothetical protein
LGGPDFCTRDEIVDVATRRLGISQSEFACRAIREFVRMKPAERAALYCASSKEARS